MIRPSISILTFSLLVAPVMAQPDAPVGQVTPAQQAEATVRNFVAALNREDTYLAAVKEVANVRDVGYFGGPAWADEWRKMRGKAQLYIEKVVVSDLTDLNAKARVSYCWVNDKPRFRSATIVEDLTLQRGVPALEHYQQWQIVPPTTTPLALEDVMGLTISPVNDEGEQLPQENPPILGEIAQRIADPKATWNQENSRKSVMNLKLLYMTLGSFEIDYDHKFAFDTGTYKQALQPYFPDEDRDIWTVPATKEEYTFNGHLSGLSTRPAQLQNAHQTVLFYEGKDETPVFRYDGRAVICFADGFVTFVTPERAKKLVWKP